MSRRPDAAVPASVRLAEIDELEVSIDKLVAGGEGIARLDGIPIFVPRAAPGDRLRVRLTERKPDYARAEIVEILTPGPGRRPDPYPALSATGLCDLQHLDDDLQSRARAQAVCETLVRMGGITLPADLSVITGEPWHYRLRTELTTEKTEQGVFVGYQARASNRLIPVQECALLVPELEALLAVLPRLLGDDPPHRIDLAAGDDGQVTSAPVIEGLPHGEVTTTVGEITYAYDARCFFQGHRGLLPKLVETAVGPWTGKSAYDLYAGVGLLALPLAKRYGHVVAVEADRIAVRYARNNARRNKLTNVESFPSALETWIGKLPYETDRVIVDPPRAGLSQRVRAVLCERPPARLTYVSCHPATLARDLRQLGKSFTIESLALLDLFPQTGHMEAVVQMVRKAEEPSEESDD
ncbi:MAG TPA: TRAM domain-containing protein [Thermoanaerobaculia bacterium]|nr:TRAM domain-containing protein [Thermoanaerobaculia bacterium]